MDFADGPRAEHQGDEEAGLERVPVRLVRGLLVGLDEARVVRHLVHEGEVPLRLLDRGRVHLAHLRLRGPEAADEHALGSLGKEGGALAEELVGVELLVDLEAAFQAEGLVVHRGPQAGGNGLSLSRQRIALPGVADRSAVGLKFLADCD